MKRKPFALMMTALIMGTLAGFGCHYVIESQKDAIALKAEEISSQQSEQSAELSEEEKSKLQSFIDELQRKYEEIKNIQVAGTTVGAIAGALVGAIVSAVPALLNRSNIKKAIENVAVVEKNLDATNEVLSNVKEKFGIVNENYDKTIAVINALSNELTTVKNELRKAESNYESIKADNEELKKSNDDLKELLILMVNHTKEYVATGTAEYVNSKFRK